MCEECGLNASGAPLRGDWDPEDPVIVEKMRLSTKYAFFRQLQDLRDPSRLEGELPKRSNRILRTIINTIALRHRKGQLLEELRLPPQKRIVITTPFTAKYAFFRQLQDLRDPSRLEGELPKRSNRILRTFALTRLRETCLRPNVRYRRTLGQGSGPLQTVGQVLEVTGSSGSQSPRRGAPEAFKPHSSHICSKS
jgi:hypothetical protein